MPFDIGLFSYFLNITKKINKYIFNENSNKLNNNKIKKLNYNTYTVFEIK